MSTHFKMTMVVPQNLVGTILELLNPESELMSVESYEAPRKGGKAPSKRSYPNRIASRRGNRGIDLVLKLITEGPKSSEDLMKAFVADGRAANSPSPLISQLYNSGKIKQLDDKRWVLAKGAAPWSSSPTKS